MANSYYTYVIGKISEHLYWFYSLKFLNTYISNITTYLIYLQPTDYN